MPASRSSRRCSQRASSTNSAWSSPRRSRAAGAGSSTACPRSGSSRCRARPHPADPCSSTTALSGRRRSRAAHPLHPLASLRAMRFPWDESGRAFADAASLFVRTAALVGDRWQEPGLGEWDVRALVGHTSRSLLTVEEYLARPAATVEVPSAPAYYAATSAMAAGPGVAARGVAAGQALGDDPATAVAGLAARVVPLVERSDGTDLLTTLAGGMRLDDYLPTRTFELAVHTCDL